jgi:hypothetical protein
MFLIKKNKEVCLNKKCCYFCRFKLHYYNILPCYYGFNKGININCKLIIKTKKEKL